MAKSRRDVICPIDPIGLKREEAAAFIRFSEGIFDQMVQDGLMPQPRQYGRLVVWDADELAAAFKALPRRRGLQASPEPAQTSEEDHVDFKL